MRLTIYLITNIFVAALLYIGFNHHVDTALSVGQGIIWVITVCCFIFPFFSQETKVNTLNNLSVPPFVDLMISLSMASYLMSQGAWGIGCAFFIASLIWASSITNCQRELAKEQTNAEPEAPQKPFKF